MTSLWMTAIDLMNDRVVLFFDEHEIAVSLGLTDRGTEFCGKAGRCMSSELYLAVEEHRSHAHQGEGARRPMASASASTRRCSDEFYRVAFRKKFYRRIDELQADLDAWLAEPTTGAASASGPLVLWQDADANLH